MLLRPATFASLFFSFACAHPVPATATPASFREPTPAIRLLGSRGEALDVKKPLLRATETRPVVEGLDAGEWVTFRAKEGLSESWARLRASEQGTLDVTRAPALEGTWEGADAEAWLWSMRPVSERPLGPSPLVLTVERKGKPALTLTVNRTDISPEVTVTAVKQPQVNGDWVMPRGDGPFPALIVLGGAEGSNGASLRRALDLATAGFACLALSYFGDDGLEPTLSKIPVERVGEALTWVAAQPHIDGQRLGLVGDSRGGELALIAAANFRQVRAVAAIVPSGLQWGALKNPNETAWTLGGKPLAFVPWSGVPAQSVRDAWGRTTVTSLGIFTSSLSRASPSKVAAATIPVENISGPVLLIGAKDDQVWPSCQLAEVARARLAKHDHLERYGDVLRCFEGAGHRIGVPGSSTMSHSREIIGDTLVNKGGTPQGAARAERETRAMLRAHFERALKSYFFNPKPT